jgi:hypothetical protein
VEPRRGSVPLPGSAGRVAIAPRSKTTPESPAQARGEGVTVGAAVAGRTRRDRPSSSRLDREEASVADRLDSGALRPPVHAPIRSSSAAAGGWAPCREQNGGGSGGPAAQRLLEVQVPSSLPVEEARYEGVASADGVHHLRRVAGHTRHRTTRLHGHSAICSQGDHGQSQAVLVPPACGDLDRIAGRSEPQRESDVLVTCFHDSAATSNRVQPLLNLAPVHLRVAVPRSLNAAAASRLLASVGRQERVDRAPERPRSTWLVDLPRLDTHLSTLDKDVVLVARAQRAAREALFCLGLC